MNKIKTIHNPLKLTQEEKEFVSKNDDTLLKKKKNSYISICLFSGMFSACIWIYKKSKPFKCGRKKYEKSFSEYFKEHVFRYCRRFIYSAKRYMEDLGYT